MLERSRDASYVVATSLFTSLLSLSACNPDDGDPPLPYAEDQVDSPAVSHGSGESEPLSAGSSQAIVNGSDISRMPTDMHGIVALWANSLVFGEARQLCTGTLLTNDVVLTAAHCLTSSDYDYSSLFIMLGTIHSADLQWRWATWGEFDASGYDVAYLGVHAPFTLRGSTTGFRRVAGTGHPGETVFAGGYGNTRASQTAPPSTICAAGTQGCLYDPRLLRGSLHTSAWDSTEPDYPLLITPNANNQFPTWGDSGSGLHRHLGWDRPLLDQVLVGVFAENHTVNGVWHQFYVPTQFFWTRLCDFANCSG